MFEQFGLFTKSPEDCSKNIFPEQFTLPISYLDASSLFVLEPHVVEDLELEHGRNPDGHITASSSDNNQQLSQSEYLCIPQTPTAFTKYIVQQSKHLFTNDIDYLTETQTIIQRMRVIPKTIGCTADECTQTLDVWKTLKNTSGFMEKYGFMEFSMLEHLNTNNEFMQASASLSFISPLTSFLIPIIFFLFPFLLLRLKGIPITFSQYLETLREISKNHFIGKLLNIKSWSVETILYLVFTGGLYGLQLYQNAVSCYHFYYNIRHMNTLLLQIREQCAHTVHRMQTFATVAQQCPHYYGFLATMAQHQTILQSLADRLAFVKPFEVTFRKWLDLGNMLTDLYALHGDLAIEHALQYAVGFNGYFSNLLGMAHNPLLHCATFTTTKSTHIHNQFYSSHTNAVKNDCVLRKNMIISGVNASGKTTFLKTTALNIIFTQQYGVGFYDACRLRPYTHIHSYLNIPDTSGRDSLFQAESRRCKGILDIIHSAGEEARHFCIFDELYSGTNPKEATHSAIAFLKYLAKRHNVQFLLTTHYIQVCRHFRKHSAIANYQMRVDTSADGAYIYTYKLKKGITKLCGGLQILKNMDYPAEIINSMENI